jgi:hypothetical protein
VESSTEQQSDDAVKISTSQLLKALQNTVRQALFCGLQSLSTVALVQHPTGAEATGMGGLEQ